MAWLVLVNGKWGGGGNGSEGVASFGVADIFRGPCFFGAPFPFSDVN
jgi:hypothetical protein